MTRGLLVCALALAASACPSRPVAAPPPGATAPLETGVCGGCRAFALDEVRGAIPEVLDELSGLVASRRQPPYLYAHNDSGDVARFFALSPTAAIQAELTLVGASASDWEDVAIGPCPAGSCVYLGDIGDNRRVRTDYAVYRVPEPTIPEVPTATPIAVPFERLPFEYPGAERHNAEALVADPESGALYLITREERGQPSQVYRFPEPLTPGRTTTLTPVGALPVPAPDDLPVTGADVSPCGDALLVRMYNRLVMMRRATGESFASLFSARPLAVPVADEPQGEAVAFSADGQRYYTASERRDGAAFLHMARCR